MRNPGTIKDLDDRNCSATTPNGSFDKPLPCAIQSKAHDGMFYPRGIGEFVHGERDRLLQEAVWLLHKLFYFICLHPCTLRDVEEIAPVGPEGRGADKVGIVECATIPREGLGIDCTIEVFHVLLTKLDLPPRKCPFLSRDGTQTIRVHADAEVRKVQCQKLHDPLRSPILDSNAEQMDTTGFHAFYEIDQCGNGSCRFSHR